ncbi:hemerythrin domain-containing protein [Neisseria animalis]|uniref:Hemerythrin domain-containing protein n=1 Tax=Neisseria animalis TaxID=492 RepID=A0A5P3MPV7_NEIAN|nr:hemerythrin domain-containing protein [Neisseria animalis]QEY23574.1 hemerythrin domain-containing protein [Neisseria animalis]ROW32719.1 hemerythrin domain-containing protein [Neisseria animalis]VEE09251.1 Uncharacterized conserved protein [Neisseria animalis]
MKPLKRHSALIELSREHHHSLALCLRILRAPSESHQAEIEPHAAELAVHFQEEEQQFAPYWAHIDPALRERFENDHAKLRGMMAEPRYTDEAWNTDFATTLREHARFEERELFPAVEPYLPEASA